MKITIEIHEVPRKTGASKKIATDVCNSLPSLELLADYLARVEPAVLPVTLGVCERTSSRYKTLIQFDDREF